MSPVARIQDAEVKVVWTIVAMSVLFSQLFGAMTSACLEDEVEIKYNETFTICCSTCRTGYGVDVQCTPSDDTHCNECVSGRTYSDITSHEDICKPCSTCGNNTLFVLHPCNTTQNTLCLCPEGSYYDSEADQCKLCDLCPAGWGASRKCNTYHNTICSPCENNVTFSDKLDYYSQCEPCTVCSASKVMLQECITTKDTICFSYNAGRPPTEPPRGNYSTPSVLVEDEENGSDIFPVYCSALVLVIVGLVGYVIFKKYQRMRSKRRQKAPCSHEDVEYSKASGGDSGVFVESDSPKNYSYCLTSRVRDLPLSKRKELEKILSSPQSDSWKLLAKELGYSNKRLSQFESKRNTENNSCFKHMLHDWERRDMATVSHLIQCLRNIGREDAARIIYIDTTEGRTHLLSKQHSVSQNMV